MLAGALDPLEGSVVILVGSGLVTLGTFLGKSDAACAFTGFAVALIAVGVGAMFALSAMGGFGGRVDARCGGESRFCPTL